MEVFIYATELSWWWNNTSKYADNF